jgi:hypothetical protein
MENLISWIQLLLDNLSPWVKVIQHPMVLAGFALMLFVGLAKGLSARKLSGKDSGKLYGKLINGALVLALLIIVLGLGQSFIPKPAEQVIRDNKGIAVNAQGNVSQGGPSATNPTSATPPKPINQSIDGNQGTAINSGGDVQLAPPPKPETKHHAR